jgi:hypothetical protein
VRYCHLPGGTEENGGKFECSRMYRSGFDSATSRIRYWSHLRGCFVSPSVHVCCMYKKRVLALGIDHFLLGYIFNPLLFELETYVFTARYDVNTI